MNRDIEDFPEIFLAWLLQSDRAIESSVEFAHRADSTEEALEPPLWDDEIENWELDELDLLESEALKATLSSPSEAAVCPPPSRPGDIPVIQDRFQELVKRRLQAELQKNPPRFPWETEISDDEPDVPVPEAVVTNQLWTAQLQRFRLPVSIPPDIFAQLLERCQTAIQSSKAEGAKLVRAVEALFPGQSQVLHKFAGIVLASTAAKSAETVDFAQVESKLPSSYETATLNEQMVLLLIAARQIIGALTLTLSPSQPIVERQWLTAVGMLTIQAEYQVERRLFASLRVEGQLPYGGSLKLQVGQSQAIAQRPDSGKVSVELFDLEVDQTYPLEILFPELDRNPLIFAICPTA